MTDKISDDVRMIGAGCKKKRKIELLRGWVEELRASVFEMGAELDSLRRNINSERAELLHRLDESEKYRLRVVGLVNELRAKFEIDELDGHLHQILRGEVDYVPREQRSEKFVTLTRYESLLHYVSANVTKIRNALSFAEAKASDCAFGSVDPLKQTLSAPR